MSDPLPSHPDQGILAGVRRLTLWLQISLVLLTAASVARYLDGHGWNDRTLGVVLGAVLLLVVFAAQALVSTRAPRWLPPAWFGLLALTWAVLVVLAPSFAWCAVPLAFVALRVLAFGWACASIAAMVVVVALAWWRMQESVDPTVLVGPVCVAVLAVMAYRALVRAQGDLATAERRAGVLAERERLARDIHDGLAQGFTSINLLLQAADQDWDTRPDVARDHVDRAARTARSGLGEVRRVVHDLAASTAVSSPGTPGPDALVEAACVAALQGSGLELRFQSYGAPGDLGETVVNALVRTAQGAVANAVEHAEARLLSVTLTHHQDEVLLDICDDGRGFDPHQIQREPLTGRGHGLAGLRARAETLGGRLSVETGPGEGTTVAISLPVIEARR